MLYRGQSGRPLEKERERESMLYRGESCHSLERVNVIQRAKWLLLRERGSMLYRGQSGRSLERENQYYTEGKVVAP